MDKKENDRIYNIFIQIINYYSNEEIIKLTSSLEEYIKNDNKEDD